MVNYIRSRRRPIDIKDDHNKILDLYKKSCQGNWILLQDDGYIHDHLIYHTIGAGDKKTMKELLTNFKWLQIRLKNRMPYAVLDDFIKSRSILDLEVVANKITDLMRYSSSLIIWTYAFLQMFVPSFRYMHTV